MRSLMMAAQVHAKTLCAKADNFSTLSPRWWTLAEPGASTGSGPLRLQPGSPMPARMFPPHSFFLPAGERLL